MIRLQKALADRGVASRRRAEELITEGRVRVNGEAIMTLGTKVDPDARIDVDGVLTHKGVPRYVLLNKPKGIVSTANDERGRKTVVQLVGARERLYPVGRLDTDSEGMLLLTNDGDWAERVLHPRFGHEREYDVSVSGELTPEATAELRNGIRLEEGLAIASHIAVRSRSRGASRLTIVLHTGWRRQIRRMLSAVGLKTVRLVRVRIGNVTLGKLREGEWRELTLAEITELARPTERPRAAPRPAPSPVATSARVPAQVAAPKPSGRAKPRRVGGTGTPRARGLLPLPSAQRSAPRSASAPALLVGRPHRPPRDTRGRPPAVRDARSPQSRASLGRDQRSGARRDGRAATGRNSRSAPGRDPRSAPGRDTRSASGRDTRSAPARGGRPVAARPTRALDGRARAPQRRTFPLRPGGRRPLPKYGTSRGPVRAKIAPR